MMVKSEGSRSSCSGEMPRAIRAISMPSHDALLAQRIGVERLVGQHRHVAQRIEMADRGVEIDRLDRIARDEVDAVEDTARA